MHKPRFHPNQEQPERANEVLESQHDKCINITANLVYLNIVIISFKIQMENTQISESQAEMEAVCSV